MDETYGTYVDDMCFDIHDYDDDDDTDHDTDDLMMILTMILMMMLMMILMTILMMVGAGTENRSCEGPNSYLR